MPRRHRTTPAARGVWSATLAALALTPVTLAAPALALALTAGAAVAGARIAVAVHEPARRATVWGLTCACGVAAAVSLAALSGGPAGLGGVLAGLG